MLPTHSCLPGRLPTMQDESGKRDRHFLALTLKPADGSAPAAEGEMVEAELAFANLAPRGALVRQIYEQLSPLLAADLKQAAQRGARAVAAAGSEAAGASGPTEAKKEK